MHTSCEPASLSTLTPLAAVAGAAAGPLGTTGADAVAAAGAAGGTAGARASGLASPTAGRRASRGDLPASVVGDRKDDGRTWLQPVVSRMWSSTLAAGRRTPGHRAPPRRSAAGSGGVVSAVRAHAPGSWAPARRSAPSASLCSNLRATCGRVGGVGGVRLREYRARRPACP